MKGSIQIDGVIGLVIFLAFVSWSIAYYSFSTSQLAESGSPLESAVTGINEKILNFLWVDVTELLVINVSENNTVDSILFLDYIWPEGTKNSTKILSGSTLLPCQIIGNTIYWQTNLVNTTNYFTMRLSTQNVSMNCTASFSIENESETIPFTGETRKMVSQERIDNMTNTSYDIFRDNLAIDRDFFIEINTSGTVTTYGRSVPVAGDVFVMETLGVIEETNQNTEIRIRVF